MWPNIDKSNRLVFPMPEPIKVEFNQISTELERLKTTCYLQRLEIEIAKDFNEYPSNDGRILIRDSRQFLIITFLVEDTLESVYIITSAIVAIMNKYAGIPLT
jgi:hypothetical protein